MLGGLSLVKKKFSGVAVLIAYVVDILLILVPLIQVLDITV